MLAVNRTNGQPGTRPRVLCVDDEPYVLEGLQDTLRRHFDVRVATSGVEGLRMLGQDPDAYAVVVSDMRMPQMDGSNFLRESRRIAPNAVRMLLTGQADVDAAIRGVNEAQLFRFLTKPCESDELTAACAAAADQHRLLTAERVLLEQTLRGSVNALVEVLSLTNPAAFGRGGRVKALVTRLANALALENTWEIEVAAMLAHVGAVTLPQATAEKLYTGGQLTDNETAMVERIPEVTRRLLAKIPRLEGVLEILDTYTEPFAHDANSILATPVVGARVLRIAVDYDALESGGATPAVALGALRSRTVYDPELLAAFGGVVGVGKGHTAVIEVSVADLAVGMTLADDVRSTHGGLLVARGHTVTEQLIDRLANLSVGQVREPLRVFEPATET